MDKMEAVLENPYILITDKKIANIQEILPLLEQIVQSVSVAFFIPFLKIIGFAPAARFLIPAFTIACASTVAVVVPSPATSFVLVATSLTSCAPIFSNASASSISFAMVTPSFVIRGAP